MIARGVAISAIVVMTLACGMAACASTPAVTDALADWRAGNKPAAIAKARAEIERFRSGNHLAMPELEARLAEVDRVFDDATPILLPERAPPPTPEDAPVVPFAPGPERGLREDLASAGATRTLRAIRAIDRLGLRRFAPDLMVAIWRREPWSGDGPLLADVSPAVRSVVVKLAALRALERL